MEIRFYKTASGRSPVEEFLDGQSQQLQQRFLNAVMLLAKGEKLAFPVSRSLSKLYRGLHELRLRDRAGIYRMFYFVRTGEAIYFLHAFKKKTQRLPEKDIDLVLSRIQEI